MGVVVSPECLPQSAVTVCNWVIACVPNRALSYQAFVHLGIKLNPLVDQRIERVRNWSASRLVYFRARVWKVPK